MATVHTLTTDVRSAPRASIYLAATLYCDSSPFAVKIRNISATGALVEGASTPSSGSLVQLVRGGLIVHGLIAWSSEGRCGIKFSGSVDVHKWRAAPTSSEQQRVDEAVRLIKAGAVPLPVPPSAQASERADANGVGVDMPADLRRVSRLLEDLGASLSIDDHVIARHCIALQNLDIATQMLAALTGVISGEVDLEIEPTKLIGLRRSADQALSERA